MSDGLRVPAPVVDSLCDPVTLLPLDPLFLSEAMASSPVLELRAGGLSAKNLAELGFARNEYAEPDGATYVERLPHMVHPMISPESVVLDIGCGPRDFLSGMPGHHIFVDDIMDAYVNELGASFDGLPICARTELLPFVSGSIDVIYSINMIDHVDDMVATANELRRVISDDGVVVLQSYFNSHPLLPSEPGVFDSHYLSEVLEPLFILEAPATHVAGGPTISDYYTMDVITCVLRPRPGVVPESGDRKRYDDGDYLGPQSHVTASINALDERNAAAAELHVNALVEAPFYEVHYLLLQARLHTLVGDFSKSLEVIKVLRSHPRVRRNAYARIALLQVDIERVRESAVGPAGRVTELEEAVESKSSRIRELDSVIIKRDDRIAELQAAIAQRDERTAGLRHALAQSHDNKSALDRQVEDLEAQLRLLNESIKRRKWWKR